MPRGRAREGERAAPKRQRLAPAPAPAPAPAAAPAPAPAAAAAGGSSAPAPGAGSSAADASPAPASVSAGGGGSSGAAAEELVSLLAGMTGTGATAAQGGTAAPSAAVGVLALGSRGVADTKLAAAAPQRHKLSSPGESDGSSSDSSSGESSSDDSDASGSDGGGIWVTPHDPNRPKRPQTSFFLFSAEKRRELTGTANARVVSAAWNALDEQEKARFDELAAKEAQRYQRAMASYSAPPKIQLNRKPTPEQEQLYAKELSRHRAKRERRRQRRRAAAQVRREEREKAKALERSAQQAARQEQQRKQALDVARLRERNELTKTANSEDDEDAEEEQQAGPAPPVAEPGPELPNGSSEGHTSGDEQPRKLRERRGRGRRQATSRSAGQTNQHEAEKSSCNGNHREGTAREKASGVAVKPKAKPKSKPKSKPKANGINAASDGNAAANGVVAKSEHWRAALDVWSTCICQDVTMAWYEALVVDVRKDEVLIRYIAWDSSFDEWMPRSSERLAERGTRRLAHMAATDVEGLRAISEEEALHLAPGTLIWLKWDSPGFDGHNEWWSALVRKPLAGASKAKKGRGKGWSSTTKPSKLARAVEGWYRLDFTSFLCNDGFDLQKAAREDKLRMGDNSETL